MSERARYFRKAFFIAFALLVADQLSKEWLLDMLYSRGEAIPLLPFFKLVMVWNQGVSFGLFAGDSMWHQAMLIAVAVVIIGFLLVWLWQTPRMFTAIAIGSVIGGAVGNIIDRVRFGAVADFFYFHYEEWYWPAFNIADSAIFIGVVLLCWESMVNPSEKNEE